MKSILKPFLLILPVILLAVVSCETIIDPRLEAADPVLVIDAWIDNRSAVQTITLTRTQGYFDVAQIGRAHV